MRGPPPEKPGAGVRRPSRARSAPRRGRDARRAQRRRLQPARNAATGWCVRQRPGRAADALRLERAERADPINLLAPVYASPRRRRRAIADLRPASNGSLTRWSPPPPSPRTPGWTRSARTTSAASSTAPLATTPTRQLGALRLPHPGRRSSTRTGSAPPAMRRDPPLRSARRRYHRELSDLVGEPATRSHDFRELWAAQTSVADHTPDTVNHPVVGSLELHFERLEVRPTPTADRGPAPPNRVTVRQRSPPASWAETETATPNETSPSPANQTRPARGSPPDETDPGARRAPTMSLQLAAGTVMSGGEEGQSCRPVGTRESRRRRARSWFSAARRLPAVVKRQSGLSALGPANWS